MYMITLHDGTKLENLELNGNNFIAETAVDDSVFENNLSTVDISDGTTTRSYTDMFLVCNRIENGRSWIVLAEKSEQQKAAERIMANAADMTDVQAALVEIYEMLLGGNNG